MAFTMLAETGVAGTVGAPVSFSQLDSKRAFQVNPKPGTGFTGTVLVEISNAPSPGANDWSVFATHTISAHTQNYVVNHYTDAPWMRVRLPVSTAGAVSVYATN